MVTKRDCFIVSAVRTPIGGFNGSLASFSAVDLGSIAIKGALERVHLKGDQVEEVFFGNVLSANVGQNPARQAALAAGVSVSAPCTTLNKVCASGMKAIQMGASQILMGSADIVIVGGMESMSNTPYYSTTQRFGSKYGHQEMYDGIVKDGLTDPFNKFLMGDAAEIIAEEMKFTREDQDNYAISTYQKAQAATSAKLFSNEIIPIEIPGARGKPGKIVDVDDEVSNVIYSAF